MDGPFGGESAESYHDEGLTRFVKGDFENAAWAFRKAIELDPDLLTAHHQLAKCLTHLGQPERAATILKRVVTARPSLVAAEVDLGYALLAANRLEEARQRFAEVVTAQPDNTRAHLGLARVFFEQGQWASALANARTVLNASGSNFQALFVGGRAAKLTGEPEAAQEYFDRADKMLEQSIEANPDQPESYYLRGETQFAAGDYGKAYEHFTAAESRTAQNKTYSAYGEQFNLADVYVKLGLCMQRLGNPDRAKRFGEQALEIAPDNRLAQSLCEREN